MAEMKTFLSPMSIGRFSGYTPLPKIFLIEMRTKGAIPIKEKISKLKQSEILTGMIFLFATVIFLAGMVLWTESVITIFPVVLWLTIAIGVVAYIIRCHKLQNNLIKELGYAMLTKPREEKKEALLEDLNKGKKKFLEEDLHKAIMVLSKPMTFPLYDYWCGNCGVSKTKRE